MSDNEKIVAKLQDAAAYFRSSFDAMYGTVACEKFRSWTDAIEQAIALLKAQEPRVMTLEEVKSLKQDAVVWYEHTGINGPRPRIVHYADDRCIVFTDGGKWQYDADGYGNLWRCWTSRPTDAQREAIPWE